MAGMYNVLEKLRSGEALTTKEKIIREQGLVSVLTQLCDELEQGELAVTGTSSFVETKKQAKVLQHSWPKSLPDQVRVLRGSLTAHSGSATVKSIARQFTRVRKDRVEKLLETLVAMGQARKVGAAQFVGG